MALTADRGRATSALPNRVSNLVIGRREPDYSGGAARLAIPPQSGTTKRVCRGDRSVARIPLAAGVQT